MSLCQSCRARGLTTTVGPDRAARRILHQVDLYVEMAEVVAVRGRSGSGKSTLLNLIGGLDRPDAGTIRRAGQELTRRRPKALARVRLDRIGFGRLRVPVLPTH